MTTVNTLTTPKKGTLSLGTTPAALSPLRHVAIESALSLALHHTQNGDIHAATGRAVRAATLLKRACTEATNAGRV
jgi:hypothetical protein